MIISHTAFDESQIILKNTTNKIRKTLKETQILS